MKLKERIKNYTEIIIIIFLIVTAITPFTNLYSNTEIKIDDKSILTTENTIDKNTTVDSKRNDILDSDNNISKTDILDTEKGIDKNLSTDSDKLDSDNNISKTDILDTDKVIDKNLSTDTDKLEIKFKGEKNDPLEIPIELLIVEHISSPIKFKKGLFLYEYQDLLREYFLSNYPEIFQSSISTKYFIRTLAEITYSLNGYLPVDDFNEIVDARDIYLEIGAYIEELEYDETLKAALDELYVLACIYVRIITDPQYPIEKINLIPDDAILVDLTKQTGLYPVVAEDQDPDYLYNSEAEDQKPDYIDDSDLGTYVGNKPGINLYYICASFYDEFPTLSKNDQIAVLDYIYSFNPTLMLAPSLNVRYNFYDYIRQLFLPPPKPELLKYCLRGDVSWLILPKTIKR